MVVARFRNVDQILKLVDTNAPKFKFGKFKVKLGSIRLQCFRRSKVCAYCGRIGAVFVLELDYSQHSPHLNLYTSDGVLMTKDHIIPSSKGGPTTMENLQTMCEPCNHKKGDK